MNDPTIASVLDHAVDKLSGGAAEIAKAAKQVAPHAWEVAVRQQVIEGWTGIAEIAVALCIVGVCALALRHAIRNKDEVWAEVVIPIAGVGGGVVLLVTLIVGMMGLPELVSKIANPEYMAARSILEAVK